MVLGGVETELITILSRFDKTEYDITLLLLYEQDKSVIEKIPEGVKVVNLGINRRYYCSGLSGLVWERLRRFELGSALGLCAKKIFSSSPTGANVNIDKIPTLEGEWDVAVCYHIHSPIMMRYVADKVKAKRKIGWVHNDFSTTHYDIAKYESWLNKYDAFAAVSERLCKELIERCPSLRDKAEVVHNIVDERLILERSKKTEELDERFAGGEGVKLLTVGRFVEQKGFDIAVEAAKILKERELNFTWYIIGYGAEEENIRALVEKYNLGDRFIILGRRDNPYIYMAGCDLYVQPSRHEGYPITLCEALALDKTVLCTDFAGARELIESEDDGVVVGSFEPSDIAEEIEKYILSPERLKRGAPDGEGRRSQADWERIKALF